MKKIMTKLLLELLKNSKRSDRELAKILGVSQPTITRTRHKLEENGLIQDYTIIPDFRKMGFEILAVTFVKMRPGVLIPETIEKAKKYAEKIPHAILSCTGEGLGMNGVVISFHKDYADYHRHLNQLRVDWKDFLKDIRSFIVALGEEEFKRFSLTYLKDVPL
ncbi:MAG: winged helix-turn-helix transcriptional regulator [Candidatus Bathyarchaeota archaeon]|nr:MAG: winged helix-turn-helix transcriptional regulator [Candidatus Bathyarchaeota archaeon]